MEIESILTSIKKLLGIDESDTNFDTDVIMHVNSVFMILNGLGVGPSGFSISDDSKTWKDFLGTDPTLEGVKTYIYMKVRLIFDPPTVGAVLESYKEQIKEFEWRLSN